MERVFKFSYSLFKKKTAVIAEVHLAMQSLQCVSILRTLWMLLLLWLDDKKRKRQFDWILVSVTFWSRFQPVNKESFVFEIKFTQTT